VYTCVWVNADVHLYKIWFLRTTNERKPFHGRFGVHLNKRFDVPLATVILVVVKYIHRIVSVFETNLILYTTMAICNDNNNNNNNNSNNNNNVDGWPSTWEGTRAWLQLIVYPRSPEPNQQSLFGGNEGQSFHYGSLSAAVDRQSSQLGRPLRNVFLPAPSQSVRNLYNTKHPAVLRESDVNFQFSTFFRSTHTHIKKTHNYVHKKQFNSCSSDFIKKHIFYS
jgi:hypothetical protein